MSFYPLLVNSVFTHHRHIPNKALSHLVINGLTQNVDNCHLAFIFLPSVDIPQSEVSQGSTAGCIWVGVQL